MIKTQYKKYEAMGFVEALIAIIVVGVASVVLMQIAATTMSDAVENERIDKMTQYAIEGATMTENIVQELYEFGTQPDIDQFIGIFNVEKCLIPIPDPDVENPGEFIFKPTNGSIESYSLSTIQNQDKSIKNPYREKAQISSTPPIDYFRYACIRKNKPFDPQYLIVTIIVGHIPSEGNITARRNVKDYTYSTIINLNP